jgi:hypothetical protein
MATIRYEADADRFVLSKTAIDEKFFDLSSGLAGEVMQKFINYRVKVAIVGDFSHYTSKSLKDFIFECNQGRVVFFLPSEQDAIERLSMV